jgi:Protein of unknown function (DUF2510)
VEGQPPQQQPPGWYPNPEGPGQRYWDGTSWTEQVQGQPAPQAPPPAQAGTPKKESNLLRNCLIAAVAVLLLAGLAIGGCVALIGGAADEVGDEIEKSQNRNAITNTQARQLEIGTRRSVVEERFGPPENTQEGENEGLGRDSCIYYNIKGGSIGDQWQFCFEGSGRNGKLRSKNRY